VIGLYLVQSSAVAPSSNAAIVPQPEATPFLRPYNDWPRPAWESATADPVFDLDVIGKIVVVIALLYLALHGLKAWTGKQRPHAATGATIHLVETIYLAPNRALHLVQVGGSMLLIGMTEQNISLLARLDDEAQPAVSASHAPFAAVLEKEARMTRQASPGSRWTSANGAGLSGQAQAGSPDWATWWPALERMQAQLADLRRIYTSNNESQAFHEDSLTKS